MRLLNGLEAIVAGWREVSLVDVIGAPSFTVWFSHCNFKCPWCSNSRIASGIEGRPIKISEIVDAVKQAAPFVEYLHVTGGEPTLQMEPLHCLFKAVKRGLSLLTSLSTNGSNPSALRRLMPLLDHVAIDVKAPLSDPGKYAVVAGVRRILAGKVVSKVRESILISLEAPFLELRTTIVPGLIGLEEFEAILIDIRELVEEGEVRGRVAYVIQQFIPYEGVRDPLFSSLKRTPPGLLKRLARLASQRLPFEVYVRSIEEGTRRVGGPARIRTGDHHLS